MSLVILNIISVAVTMILGIVGTVFSLKNGKADKLTTAGKLTVIGIFTAAVISGVIQITQYKEQEKMDLARDGRAEKIADGTDRILNPIHKIEFTLDFDVQKNNLGVSPILSTLAETVDKMKSDKRSLNALGISDYNDGENSVYVTAPNSELALPSIPIPAEFRMIIADIYLFDSAADWSEIAQSKRLPDIIYNCPLYDKNDGQGPFLFYSPKEPRYWMQASIDAPLASRNTRHVVSVKDLPGSIIAISFRQKNLFVMRDATISLGEGQAYDIPGFEKKIINGTDFFIYKFPLNADFSNESRKLVLHTYKLSN